MLTSAPYITPYLMISLARITWQIAKKLIFRLKLNNNHLMSWYRSNTRTLSGFLCLSCKHDGMPDTLNDSL